MRLRACQMCLYSSNKPSRFQGCNGNLSNSRDETWLPNEFRVQNRPGLWRSGRGRMFSWRQELQIPSVIFPWLTPLRDSSHFILGWAGRPQAAEDSITYRLNKQHLQWNLAMEFQESEKWHCDSRRSAESKGPVIQDKILTLRPVCGDSPPSKWQEWAFRGTLELLYLGESSVKSYRAPRHHVEKSLRAPWRVWGLYTRR